MEIYILLGVQLVSLIAVLAIRGGSNNKTTKIISESIENLSQQLNQRDDLIRQLLSEKLSYSQELIDSKLMNITAQNKNTLEQTATTVSDKLEGMQRTITTALETIRSENRQQLDNINRTVNERLEKSISQQLSRSHQQIFANLQTMTEKITQLNTIGTDITKLNRTLSNVKRRGIFGETQLFSIVEDILPAEQYQKNFRTNDSSNEVVECAVKLPSDDESELYMPIDAKFPQDKYTALIDARESLEQEAISVAEKELKNAIIASAREICKYLGKAVASTDKNTRTTDYGIMFLPTESLYAEALSLDAVNVAQRDYKIYIVGPTNLSALLTVFKTAHQSLALQEKTREVERILSDTKAEFEKFSTVLDKVKRGMDAAQKNLDTLIGTRTNTIRRALKNITAAQSQFTAPTLDQLALLDEPKDE